MTTRLTLPPTLPTTLNHSRGAVSPAPPLVTALSLLTEDCHSFSLTGVKVAWSGLPRRAPRAPPGGLREPETRVLGRFVCSEPHCIRLFLSDNEIVSLRFYSYAKKERECAEGVRFPSGNGGWAGAGPANPSPGSPRSANSHL